MDHKNSWFFFLMRALAIIIVHGMDPVLRTLEMEEVVELFLFRLARTLSTFALCNYLRKRISDIYVFNHNITLVLQAANIDDG
jgi:hypothetical protein